MLFRRITYFLYIKTWFIDDNITHKYPLPLIGYRRGKSRMLCLYILFVVQCFHITDPCFILLIFKISKTFLSITESICHHHFVSNWVQLIFFCSKYTYFYFSWQQCGANALKILILDRVVMRDMKIFVENYLKSLFIVTIYTFLMYWMILLL